MEKESNTRIFIRQIDEVAEFKRRYVVPLLKDNSPKSWEEAWRVARHQHTEINANPFVRVGP